jgi:hypothetical protein
MPLKLWRWRKQSPEPVQQRAVRQEVHVPKLPASSEWIIGWKVANLIITPDRQIMFEPVVQNGIIRAIAIDAVAECGQYTHPALTTWCHCGFNAFETREDAERIWSFYSSQPRSFNVTKNVMMLRVGLYGRVLEGSHGNGYKWGYRAAQQRAANVFVPRWCGAPGCSERAIALGLAPGELSYALPGTDYFRPLCDLHSSQSSYALKLEEATRKTDVEFLWYDAPSN